MRTPLNYRMESLWPRFVGTRTTPMASGCASSAPVPREQRKSASSNSTGSSRHLAKTTRPPIDVTFVSQFGTELIAGQELLSGCVLVCMCSGLSALAMAAPRVCYAISQSGELIPPLGRSHSRFGTPVNAVLLRPFCLARCSGPTIPCLFPVPVITVDSI